MTQTPTRWLIVLVAFVVGLPVAGWWSRRDAEPRCAFDGLPLQPAYQMRVVDSEGCTHRFCGVRCGRLWLERRATTPQGVWVTDEPSGEELDARFAHFVHSSVPTDAVNGNRVHVFRDPRAAEEHARAYHGWALTGAERPFPTEASSAEAFAYPSP
jgi:hypothetical protein